MIYERLNQQREKYKSTLLGIGPMSVNCVDAAVELANHYDVDLMMIASRRQIECHEFGGGYVNNWTTETFSKYVFEKDKKGKIILARDHGGPWQNKREVSEKMGLRNAMESAKLSYKVDIDSGFQILHIDPSIDIHAEPTVDNILDRLFELYEYCWTYAQRVGKEVIFEIGTEEQTGGTNSQEDLDYILARVFEFCNSKGIPSPVFVVVQTGTRVMETRNVGTFDFPIRVANEIPAEIQIPRMIEVCRRYGVLLKEHNTDYLSDGALQWHPRLGIHAANVAPEFGVAETRTLLELMEVHKLDSLRNQFIELVNESRAWEKWILPDSKATDRDRALIAGHYVFATPEFRAIKEELESALDDLRIDVNTQLINAVKTSILRYMRLFRLVNSR